MLVRGDTMMCHETKNWTGALPMVQLGFRKTVKGRAQVINSGPCLRHYSMYTRVIIRQQKYPNRLPYSREAT